MGKHHWYTMTNPRFSPPFRKIGSAQPFSSLLPKQVDCRIYVTFLLAICLVYYSVPSTDSSVLMTPSSSSTTTVRRSAHERVPLIHENGLSTNSRPLVLLPISMVGVQTNHPPLSLTLAETPHNQTTMTTSITVSPSLQNSTANGLYSSRRAMEDENTLFPTFHQIVIWSMMIATTAVLLVVMLSNILRLNPSFCSRQNKQDDNDDDDNSEHDYNILNTSNAREIGYGSFSRTSVWQGNYSDKFDI